jgi:pyruvate dehydrogenase E2 component (dihydrolipoamide acetyltransferase)
VVKVSPAVRALAEEHGLDLTGIAGTGPGGRIVRHDIESLIAPSAPPSRLTRAQSLIARRMTEARQAVPDFAVSVEIDMEPACRARDALKHRRDGVQHDGGVQLGPELVPSFNDMIVKACALALRAYPYANASYRDGEWELHPEVNIGVAVAGDRTLVVPVIRGADVKSMSAIALESQALVKRVRDGNLAPADVADATFTVSNLGMLGVDMFEAVINPPQAAILAVGAIKARPVVRDDALAVARTVWVTLACDHRVLYGADAARFVAELKRLLEDPASLGPLGVT